MREVLFVVNPAAGSGRAGEVWRSLRALHPEIPEGRTVLEPDPDLARARLAQLLGPEVRRVVVVGGDGSVNVTVNAILEAELERPPAVGVVPAGTGSDLAGTLGLPGDPGEALQRALAGEPRRIDALEVAGTSYRRYAINVVSMGISGMVNEIVGAMPRRHAAAYLVGAIQGLFRYRPLACRILAGEEALFEGDLLLAAVANAPTFGRGMRVAPDARFDDGSLDVVVVPRIPTWQLPWRLGQLYRGTHVRSSRVLQRRAQVVTFEPLEPFPAYDCDGEAAAPELVKIRVLPGAVRVVR